MEIKKSSLNKFEYNLLENLLLIDKSLTINKGKILLNIQVSGGMDSMCLLHAFTKIINSKLFKSVHDFIIVAQHFNHKKRGSESDEEEEESYLVNDSKLKICVIKECQCSSITSDLLQI